MNMTTFLTELYVSVDDFDKAYLPAPAQPGPRPGLARAEVITIAILAQFSRFASERDFYRWATQNLCSYFPLLPSREQFNRLLNKQHIAIVAYFIALADRLAVGKANYQAIDCTAIPTRALWRRGSGWLSCYTDVGKSSRLGWYHGFHLIVAVTPEGVISGYGLSRASSKDQPMAESLLAARYYPDPELASCGRWFGRGYLGDKGFEGAALAQRCHDEYDAILLAPPRANSKHSWLPPVRRLYAGWRQIVESVFAKLHGSFRLERDRLHTMSGMQARLGAKMALHNFCIWLNRKLERPLLAFADLISW